MIGGPDAESPFFFQASVDGLAQKQDTVYKWTIANGHIVSGQGTPLVEVIGKGDITARVELVEYFPRCKSAVASVSTPLKIPAPPVEQVSEFASIPFRQQKKSLDELVSRLRQNPGASGYIVAYGRWAHVREALKYLTEKQGLEMARLVSLEKPRKGKFIVKLFLVPAGSVPPN